VYQHMDIPWWKKATTVQELVRTKETNKLVESFVVVCATVSLSLPYVSSPSQINVVPGCPHSVAQTRFTVHCLRCLCLSLTAPFEAFMSTNCYGQMRYLRRALHSGVNQWTQLLFSYCSGGQP